MRQSAHTYTDQNAEECYYTQALHVDVFTRRNKAMRFPRGVQEFQAVKHVWHHKLVRRNVRLQLPVDMGSLPAVFFVLLLVANYHFSKK